MEPAVKPAVELSDKNDKRVLVMATPVTIRENKLRTLLERVDKRSMVDLLPMPGLVRFAESGVFEGKEVEDYIEEQLGVFDRTKYGEVVLGCTHFNYFKPSIKKAFEDIRLIDGNDGTVRQLAKVLGISEKKEGEDSRAELTFIESGREIRDAEGLEKYMGLLKYLDSVRDIC
jgi:glutamate racemase